MSELRRDGHTFEQIAGYDTRQMFYIVCRKRDKHGRLLMDRLERLPPWVEVDDNGMRVVSNPVGFGEMFMKVKTKVQRLPKEEAARQWHEYLAANPRLRRLGGVEYAGNW